VRTALNVIEYQILLEGTISGQRRTEHLIIWGRDGGSFTGWYYEEEHDGVAIELESLDSLQGAGTASSTPGSAVVASTRRTGASSVRQQFIEVSCDSDPASNEFPANRVRVSSFLKYDNVKS
jgi:hypothetical protein